MHKPATTFERVSRWPDVARRANEARALGASVIHNVDAGTVSAERDGETLFSATRSGRVEWKITYSRSHYVP